MLHLLNDSQASYKECIEIIHDPILKRAMAEVFIARKEMIHELEIHALLLSITKEIANRAVIKSDRILVDLKTYVNSGDREAIINEIKRGENYLIENYEKALKDDLPEPLKLILHDQLNALKSNYDRVIKSA